MEQKINCVSMLNNKHFQDLTEKFRLIKDEDITEIYRSTNHVSQINRKIQVDSFNSKVTRKAVIRYLTIIADFSSSSHKQYFRPTRATATKELLREFIKEY